MTSRPAMDVVPHVVVSSLRLAGRQQTTVRVHQPGTPEAVLTVAVGRSVIYMHSVATAERFAAVWTRPTTHAAARQLPHRRPLRRGVAPADAGIAQPSVIIHAAGAPAATVALIRTPDQARVAYLNVQTGNFGVQVLDQAAFRSCADVFTQALAVATAALPTTGAPRLDHYHDPAAPRVGGAAADRAAAALPFTSGYTGAPRTSAPPLHPAVLAHRALGGGAAARYGLRTPSPLPSPAARPTSAAARLGLRTPPQAPAR